VSRVKREGASVGTGKSKHRESSVKIITIEDVRNCPTKSLLGAHYFASGRCRCERHGSMVRIISLQDPYAELGPGAEGVIDFIDALGTVHCHWRGGASLGLVPGVDRWEVYG